MNSTGQALNIAQFKCACSSNKVSIAIDAKEDADLAVS
jgi:hypothetical protein